MSQQAVSLDNVFWGIRLQPGWYLVREPWTLDYQNTLVIDVVRSMGGAIISTGLSAVLAWGSLPEANKLSTVVQILLASQDQIAKALDGLLSNANLLPRFLAGAMLRDPQGASVPLVNPETIEGQRTTLRISERTREGIRGGLPGLYGVAVANLAENFAPLVHGAARSPGATMVERVALHLKSSDLASS